MSDTEDDERQRIREQKKRELQKRLENGVYLDAADADEGSDAPDASSSAVTLGGGTQP